MGYLHCMCKKIYHNQNIMTVLLIENYSIYSPLNTRLLLFRKKMCHTMPVFLYSPVPADEFKDADVTLTTSPE